MFQSSHRTVFLTIGILLGADLIADDANGEEPSAPVVYDTNPSELDVQLLKQPHGDVDYLVAHAARNPSNNARMGVVVLPTVYGKGTGYVLDMGLTCSKL